MKKVLFVLMISLLTIAIVIGGTESKKEKELKAIELKTAMDSYNDYVAYLGFVEQYFKTEKENGRKRFDYEGEFKVIWDRMGELYEIALKDSKNGPYLTPPPVKSVCWYCYCTRIGCGWVSDKTCSYYPINCWGYCRKCYYESTQPTNDGNYCPINGSGCIN